MFLIILGAEIKHVKWSTQWQSFHCLATVVKLKSGAGTIGSAHQCKATTVITETFRTSGGYTYSSGELFQ